METQIYKVEISRSSNKLKQFIGMIIFLKFILCRKNKKGFFGVGKEYKLKVDIRSKRNSEKFIKKRETCLG